MSDEVITINALELTDDQLHTLSNARASGAIQIPAIDALADGGAQLILSFGKNFVAERYPEDLLFNLTPKEKLALDQLLNPPSAENFLD